MTYEKYDGKFIVAVKLYESECYVKRLSIFIVLILVIGLLFGCAEKEPDIVVGTKDFSESFLLGQILVLLLEEHTNYNIGYHSNMATEVALASINNDIIDLYVDYTGTIYGSILRLSGEDDPAKVHQLAASGLMERYNLVMMPPLGFNNTFTLSVSRELAERYGLRTFSDLATVSSDLIIAGSVDFLSRYDGLPNLKLLYDMHFLEERVMNFTERYHAVVEGEVHVIDAYSTDGLLVEFDLVVLEDDKNFFPPYDGAIIVRGDTLEEHPGLKGVLDMLTGIFTDDIMRQLNYRVEVLDEPIRDVAASFLREKGLIR